jgi:ectoine hydroxylase-related dioxygenase (phytanoyl-CoA dioxygenase family)
MRAGKQLKKYKLFHWLYNLWHIKSLRHNRDAYRRYGIHKPLFASISAKDFPDKTSNAWLDTGDAALIASSREDFFDFDPSTRSQIGQWSVKGYMILEKLFSDKEADGINAEIDRLRLSGKLRFTNSNKLMFANKLSPLIHDICYDKRLVSVLGFLLDKKVVPFQTINFIRGSEQKAHSDSIHMTTYPLGYLIAVWIALEDTTLQNGPLFYYPGSHKLPFLFNSDYDNDSSLLTLGDKTYGDYEDMLQDILKQKEFQAVPFLAKKGDVLIWHANLVHGGMPVEDKNTTRKSMVIHYYADDVIKYHEITERPSLMKLD